MGFFEKYIGTKATNLHDAVAKTVVSIDPDGAFDAQIKMYEEEVDKRGKLASSALTKLDEAKANVAKLQSVYEHNKTATINQSNKIDGLTDADEKAKAEATFEKLKALTLTAKADLENAQKTLEDCQSYYDERKDAHEEAVSKLMSSKQTLEAAKREQERAKQEAERAAERKREIKEEEGLSHGLDTMNIALDAMKKNTDAYREKAEADTMTTQAMKKASRVDDDVAAALAAVDTPKQEKATDHKSRIADL